MEPESAELCGIPGDDNEHVRVSQVNRLAREIKIYHYDRMRIVLERIEKTLAEQDRVMVAHIATDKEFFDRLVGVKWALWTIAGCMVPTVPLMYYMIKALAIAKII